MISIQLRKLLSKQTSNNNNNSTISQYLQLKMKALICLLLIFSLHQFVVEGKKAARKTCTSTYCEKLPKNMPSALRGYNILTGDPHQKSHDPGFKSLIFNHVKYLNGKPVLQPGITATDLYYCQNQLMTKSFANIEQYRKYTADSSKIGVDLQIGVEQKITIEANIKFVKIKNGFTIPKAFTTAWGSSSAFTKLEQFFTSKQGLLTVSRAQCNVYDMKLNTFSLPPFTEEFKKTLWLLYSYRNVPFIHPYLFKHFIKNYGTHFLSEAIMGAQFESRTRYEGSIRSTYDQTTLEECSEKKGIKIFGIQITKDKSKCTNSVEKTMSSNFGSEIHHETCTKGAKSLNFKDWQKENFKPVPLKFKLEPIVHLFKALYLDDVNLKYQGKVIKSGPIMQWFVPLYFDYCNQMGPGSCNSHNTGPDTCGVNDKCSLNSVCVAKKPGGGNLCKKHFHCHWRFTPWRTRRMYKIKTHTSCKGWWFWKKCTDHYTEYPSLHSLTDHHLKCPHNTAVNYFRLIGKNSGRKYRYNYKCCTVGLPCQGTYKKWNPYTYVHQGQTIYLDRQHAYISNGFMRGFRLDGGNKVRYILDVCRSKYKLAKYGKKCISKSTTFEWDGGSRGNPWVLDRIPVDCGNGRFLTNFRLHRNNGGGKFQYRYSCCGYFKN